MEKKTKPQLEKPLSACTKLIPKATAAQQSRFGVHKAEAIRTFSSLEYGEKNKNRPENFGSAPQSSSVRFHPEKSAS